MIKKFLRLAIGTLLVACPTFVLAAVTVNFYEQGGDVIAEVSGSLDVTGLTSSGSGQAAFIGTDSTTYFGYVFGAILPGTQHSFDVTFTSEQPFGPLGEAPTSSTAGTIGISGELPGGPGPDSDFLILPGGYTSGDVISTSSTWAGATLASLNLVPGTYSFTYAADSVTLNVLTSPPLPPPSITPTAIPVMPVWLLGLMALVIAGIASYSIRRMR